MIIRSIEGGYDKNLTYVIGCEKSGIGAIIDAAVGAEQIVNTANDADLQLKYLIITHSHHDHYASAEPLLKKLRDLSVLTFGDALAHVAGDDILQISDGETHHMGSIRLKFLHTPGHYPDCICVVANGAIFTGDTLFIGRTGRTISPKSDPRKLYQSISEKILPLPDDLVIHPGHNYGPKLTNTLGKEKQKNEFLQAEDEEEFITVMKEYEASRKQGD